MPTFAFSPAGAGDVILGIRRYDAQTQAIWQSHAVSAEALATTLGGRKGFEALLENLTEALLQFTLQFALPFSDIDINEAAQYLSAELSNPKLAFLISKAGRELSENLLKQLQQMNQLRSWKTAIEQLQSLMATAESGETNNTGLLEQWQLANAWLSALLDKQPSQKTAKHFFALHT